MIKEYKDKFEEYIGKINNNKLAICCEQILKRQTYEDFFTFPASLGHHHAYEHGLVVHTLEVADYANRIVNQFPKADRDIVLTAALWHDVAKIWDYRVLRVFSGQDVPQRSLLKEKGQGYNDYWVQDPYGQNIHHINGSNAEFTHHAYNAGVDKATIDLVAASILSHHGPVKEWGSPVQPRSAESFIVHSADFMSAAFGDTAKSNTFFNR